MTRILGLVAILVALGLPAGSGAADREPVLAVAAGKLLHVDPVTLTPSGAESLRITDRAVVVARSPDRGRLALSEGTSRLTVVDLHGLRRIATVALPSVGETAAIAWPAPERVVVVRRNRSARGGITLTVVDPVAGRVVSHRWLAWGLVDARPTRTGVVFLVQPRKGMGMAILAVAGVDGRIRSVALQVIAAGRSRIVRPGLPTIDRVEQPGLALDAAAGRAYVAGRHAIAQVDLDTLRVHDFTPRLRRPAKSGPTAGSMREASWLGNGRLALWGSDSDGKRHTPVGALLFDVKSGSLRSVDAPAHAHFRVAGGRLLAFGGIGDRAVRGGDVLGVTAFDAAGRERFRVLAGERAHVVDVSGRYAYLYRRLPSARKLRSVLDLQTGALVRTERHVWRMPHLLF